MKPIDIEKLMGHATGISDSYYRATESELLEDYLVAVDSLTLNEVNKLKRHISKQDADIYRMKAVSVQLAEKDEEMKSVKAEVASLKKIVKIVEEAIDLPKEYLQKAREKYDKDRLEEYQEATKEQEEFQSKILEEGN